ncbi:MAG: hypothetical protein GQ564_08830 [Bacteroidales bacterium]|nr:hypothetical protein [Bacteroidales bacterium]
MQNNEFAIQLNNVLKEHPLLKYDQTERVFKGTLIVDDEDNDSYKVEIQLGEFPKKFPLVWEVGERIPRKLDRHIYLNREDCCFTTLAMQQILLRKGRIKTIPDFINKIVIPYFQNNSYYEINGKYKNGEYEHGIEGVFQAYQDILELNSIKITINVLIWHLKNKKLGKNEHCFCGNGKKVKDCHLYKYNDLKYINDDTIKSDLSILIANFKK